MQVKKLLFLFLILFTNLVKGQLPDLHQERSRVSYYLPVEAQDGEVLPWAAKIFRDAQGFMWFSTRMGLLRYDGYDFRAFRPRRDDSLALKSAFISDISQSPDGHLWFAHRAGGLSQYNPFTESFHGPETWLKNDPGTFLDFVRALEADDQGRVWLAGDEGLGVLLPTKEKYVFYSLAEMDLPFETTNNLEVDPQGNLWVGLQKWGLIRVNVGNWGGNQGEMDFSIDRFPRKSESKEGLPMDLYLSLKCDHEGLLWVGGEALLLIDSRSGKVKKVWEKEIFKVEDGRNTIKHILPGKNPGEVSVLSGFRYYYFSLESDEPLLSNPFTNGIPQNGLNAFYGFWADAESGIWIGSIEGSYRAEVSGNSIEVLENVAGESAISSILVEHDGIWLGKERGGVVYYSKGKNGYHRSEISNSLAEIGLENSFISGIQRDALGKLWVATYGDALWHETEPGKPFEQIKLPIPGNERYYESLIMELAEDPQGGMWVGTLNGIFFLAPDEKTVLSLKTPVPTGFLFDDKRTWLATEKGLFEIIISPDSLKLEEVSFRQNERIVLLKKGLEGEFLLGTLDDVSYGAFSDMESERIDLASGLPGLPVHGAVQLPDGNWWFSTYHGLCEWSPDENRFRVFERPDGLQESNVSSGAMVLGPEGDIFVGTRRGLLHFHPDSLAPASGFPPLFLTGLRLFNQDHHPMREVSGAGNSTFVLDSSLVFTRNINLDWLERSISIGFAALEYGFPERIQYRYRLDGLNDRWINVDFNQRSATFTNLSPGKYVFRVQSSNRDGLWNPVETRLRVTILPPWWRSNLAYFGYTLLALALIILLYRLRLRQVRRKWEVKYEIEKARQEAREKVRLESSRDFHDEAGSRITRTNLYAELLKSELPENSPALPTLNKLQQNLREVSGVMRDFIWLLNPEQDGLATSLLRIRNFGEELFDAAGLEFVFRMDVGLEDQTQLELKVRRHLVLMFKEAMQNIVRHAEATKVTLLIEKKESGLELILTDNGIGFDRTKLKRINGLLHMEERAVEMKAGFSLQSKPGSGTELRLVLLGIHPNG